MRHRRVAARRGHRHLRRPTRTAARPDTTVAQASGDGVGTGNAVGLDVDAPITICGVGVVGGGAATGTCDGGAPAPAHAGGGGGGGGGGDTTVAQAQGNGFLSGNAIGLTVDLPINLCGIGVAVGGLAVGDCVMPAGAPLATTGSSTTIAQAQGNGFLTGNAIGLDLDAPISVCGVGVAGIGVGTGVCHVGPPPPPCKDECPPPCDDDCPPPPCKVNCGPPPPPPGCKDQCPPPPPPDRRELPAAEPIVHRAVVRGSGSVRTGQLARTGAATDVALPLGTGLVAAGLAFMAAARRRAARVGR